MKQWIAGRYPGTKLAITEYNWGPDQGGPSALAQAELLALFAREGVDLATRWVAPEPNTRVERGFSIFLDYDGAGAHVSGDSVRATSSNADEVGAYAFRDATRVMVLLINKATTTRNVALTLNAAHVGTWKLYRYSALEPLALKDSQPIAGASINLSNLPPMSASLLVVPGDDTIFANGFE